MYLLDTNVISEIRKQQRANVGVMQFFTNAIQASENLYISTITIGELRRGIEIIRHRGDLDQAASLETWLTTILSEYAEYILDFCTESAQVWGKLRVPHHENALDKQIAAIALVNSLTLVTRNSKDFAYCGVPLINPFK